MPAKPRVYLELCSLSREYEFLRRSKQSRKLHGAWIRAPEKRSDFRALVRSSKKKNRRTYFVCRVDTDELVGYFNVSEIVRGSFHSAYLGYYAFTPFAGQGYMREGLGLVLKEAFGKLELHRLEANVQPNNRRSRQLVERGGFRLEGFSPRYLKVAGRWRDHERWAITVEDFRALRLGTRLS